MPKASYDKQGKYWHHLVKISGWKQERVDALLLKRFKATHWNALSDKERREAINIMKGYAQKAEKQHAAKLRQSIMIKVRNAGYDLDWLHDMMDAWGFGRSLRELSFPQTVEVHKSVSVAVKGDDNGKR